jgi:transposase InsO family protein
MICQEVLLTYPNPDLPYDIETDASDKQLGAVIYQDGKPIAFFSRKLTSAQTRYPTIDKECLSILETLQEFRSLLWGSHIRIHTDHKNLIYRNIKSQRILNWRMIIEEFAPEFHYKPGVDNIVADTLSRYPILARREKQDEEKDQEYKHDLSGVYHNYVPEDADPSELEDAMNECLLFYPEDLDAFPLGFQNIAECQLADQATQALLYQDRFDLQEFYGTELICRRDDGDDQWRIVLPDALVDQALNWYHYVLGHVGAARLTQSFRTHFWIRKLRERVDRIVYSCDSCQRNKNPGPGQGHLPPREDVGLPWEEVAVDLVGPWKIEVPDGILEFFALTIIDTTTTLSEIVRIENKTSQHVAMHFENSWLARYPRPMRCVHDAGTEFLGAHFQSTLAAFHIGRVPCTPKNPQSNAICERMHSTVGDMLRTLCRSNPPANVATAIEMVDSALASAQYGLRTAVHRTLGVSPGALVFQRDMLLPIPILADYHMIRERRQTVIDDNNRRENLRRRYRDYEVGDEVLIFTQNPASLEERSTGPHVVEQVHSNGTLTIQRSPNVFDRLNIRRLRPYVRRP